VHISANTQPCTPSSSQSQPLEISVPEQNTYPETPEHGTTSPHDSAPHLSDPDPISRCDIQDDTDIPIEPLAFREIQQITVYHLPVYLARTTVSSIQRQLVHILILHPFFIANITIIEIPMKGLVVRMAILKQMTTLTSMIISNCTLPNIYYG